MPISHSALGIHRDRIYRRTWLVNACVARPVTKKELYATPAALEARDKEWTKLLDENVFDWDVVREWSDVAAEARRKHKTVHMGLVFGFCVQKNAELVDEPPIYKYRYVFQGNRVMDQNYAAAMFQDLGSSPATMECSKAADFHGCLKGNSYTAS